MRFWKLSESPSDLEFKEKEKKKNMKTFDWHDVDILRSLGKGGFGEVFLVFNKQKNDNFALKVCGENSDKDWDWSKISEEDQILSKIQTQFRDDFLRYYGFYKTLNKSREYVYEMEAGEINLKEILKIRKHYNMENLLYIFNSLVNQLCEFEKHGIAWGDVKPENIILVKKDNDKFYYKISDMGIALLLEENQKEIPNEKIKGFSPFYASPEIKKARNQLKKLNPFLSDVYSLGILILIMTGRIKIKKKPQPIKKEIVATFLEEIKQCQYKDLYEILKGMLEEEVNTRLSFAQIQQKLKKLPIEPSQPLDEKVMIQKFNEKKEKKLPFLDRVKKHISLFLTYMESNIYSEVFSELHISEKLFLEHKEQFTSTQKDEYELELMKCFGFYYLEVKSDFNFAKQYFLKTLEISLKLSDDQKIIDSFYNLGRTYQMEGDFKRAEMNFGFAEQRILDFSSSKTESEANVYNNLAIFYENKGDFDKAIKYYEEALQIYNDHSSEKVKAKAANVFINLGGLMRNQGDYEKCINNYEKADQIYFELNGANHRDVALSQDVLGILYHITGELEKSNEYYETAYSIRNNIQIDLAHSFISIGSLFQTKGDNTKALDNYEKAYETNYEKFGEDNLETADSLNVLAGLHYQMNNFEQSKKYFQKVLNIKLLKIGENHLSTAKTLNQIRAFYAQVKKYEKAYEHEKRVLKIIVEILGEKNIHETWFIDYINLNESEQGDFENGINHLEQVYNLRKQILGNDHLYTIFAFKNMGDAYLRISNFAKCEEIFKEIEQKFLKSENHLEVYKIYTKIVELYEMKKDYEKEVEYAEKKMQVCEKIFKETDGEIIPCLEKLKDVYDHLDNKEKKEEMEYRLNLMKEKGIVQKKYHFNIMRNFKTKKY